jgi:2-keto-4-pentenoate hydratase/2-oxohepta-3-ene-1,7-dioic acid hydratase in catechol pathway
MRTEHRKVPLIFAKFPNSLIGDGAPIRLPEANPRHVDYEGEVGVVIGRRVYAADGRVVHRNRTQSDRHRG